MSKMKYDINIYDALNLEELETIRGLTGIQKDIIVIILKRHFIKHLVKEIDIK